MVSLVTETVLMAPWLSVHILPVGRRVVRYSQDSLASLQKVCGPYPDPAIELGGSPQIINHTQVNQNVNSQRRFGLYFASIIPFSSVKWSEDA